jgi:hypothetical protein
MNSILSHVIALAAGAAGVGLWWWWIGHRAKVRALAAMAEQTAQQIGKKIGG